RHTNSKRDWSSDVCSSDLAVRAANPKEEPHLRFNRMIKWIEDHEFTNATKRGWFDVLLYQVRLHARHARVIDYWHDWEADWEKRSEERRVGEGWGVREWVG